MRFWTVFYSLCLAFASKAQLVHPADNGAFLQNEVATVRISIDPSDLNLILTDSSYADYEYPANFIYECSLGIDTINNVGFRLRGNTSRDAQKKSFKISFNSFVSGQKWFGLEKVNLNGEHNDPSIMRSRMANQLLKYAGLPSSRTSYVKLFINGEYRGLYINVEHLDEEFLQRRFINNDTGNLYKCYYGANLAFQGLNQSTYYSRYELKTNKDDNDYSGLIHFMEVLTNTNDADFNCAIQEVLDVDLYLKTLVAELLMGHWDGYTFNNNNFYLYQRPSDGKFVFIEYDMDNTFGIDWFNIDWSQRNVYNWKHEQRPLYTRILADTYFRDRFTYFFKEALDTYFRPDNLINEWQETQLLIKDAALVDTYKNLDYGFTNQDFLNAITSAAGQHVRKSLANYVNNRFDSALHQLNVIQHYQNPCVATVNEIQLEPFQAVKGFDVTGREVDYQNWTGGMLILVDKFGNSKRTFKYE